MKNKKIIREMPKNIIIMVLLFFITVKFVFNGLDIEKITTGLKSIKQNYLILGILLSLTYLIFEATNTKNILKFFGYDIKIIKTLKYAVIGFFFSAITPSATGGQPMQVYYMKKDNIKISHSIITLMLEFVAFQIVTVIIAFIGLIKNYYFIDGKDSALSYVIYTGIFLNIIFMLIVVFAIVSNRFLKLLLVIVKNIIIYIPIIKDKDEKYISFVKGLNDYRKASKFLRENKDLLLKVFPITSIQVVSLYSIAYIIYRGFGFIEFNYIKVLLIQALTSVATTSMPLPGAMGISEIINKFLFGEIYPIATIDIAVFVTRGINFYILFMFSALFFFISNIGKIFNNKGADDER